MIFNKYVFIIFLCTFLTIHFIYHKKINNNYQILQIDNKINDYTKYISEKLPIVLRNHSYSDLDNIFTPLTIYKNKVSIKTKKWIMHNKDILIVIPKFKMKVNLLLPKYITYFKKINKFNGLKLLDVLNTKKFVPITILLDKQDKLIIPRYWIFNTNKGNDTDILYSHSIFSSLFSIVN